MKPAKISKNKLHRSRRNLPHWQIGGSWYFVTFRTKTRQLPPKARDIVTEAILHFHGNRYNLSVAVVMPDHVHLLFQPLKKAESVYFSLPDIFKPIKGVSARKINTALGGKGALWMTESFDRIIRDEKEWQEKYNYIKNNAFKAGLADKPKNYEWLLELEKY